MLDVADALLQLVEEIGCRDALGATGELADQTCKRAERGRRTRRELCEHRIALRGTQQRNVPRTGKTAEFFQCRCADVPARRVDDAQERGIVVRIVDQPQIRDQVLDLGAIQKRGATGHVIRNAREPQCLLERTRLMVSAIQHRELVPPRLVHAGQMRDRGSGAFGFVFVVAAFDDAQRHALGLLAPELLVEQVRVVRDEAIRGAQDAPRTTIVLLELDDLERRIIARELGEIFRIRTAPRVDRLIVVADRRERAALAGEEFQQPVLRAVGVLAFVDEQVADALAPCESRFLVRVEHRDRQADEIVEIDCVECGQALLIVRVELGRFALAAARGARLGLVRRQAFVLRARHQRLQREQCIRPDALRQQVLHDRLAVVAVEHRKVAAQSRARVLDLQELEPERVERAHRQPLRGRRRHALGDALAHLARGLVGERDRGDLRGRKILVPDQVRHLFDDHARLAGTCSGEHEQRAVAVFDGGTLLGIEAHREMRRRRRIVPALRATAQLDSAKLRRRPIAVSPLPLAGEG